MMYWIILYEYYLISLYAGIVKKSSKAVFRINSLNRDTASLNIGVLVTMFWICVTSSSISLCNCEGINLMISKYALMLMTYKVSIFLNMIHIPHGLHYLKPYWHYSFLFSMPHP